MIQNLVKKDHKLKTTQNEKRKDNQNIRLEDSHNFKREYFINNSVPDQISKCSCTKYHSYVILQYS